MTRALLALLLLPAPAFATMTWNPSYDPKFVAAAHAGLTAPLLLDLVCAGPACGGGGGGITSSSTNTFTASQIFNDDIRLIFGTGSDAAVEYNTTQTVDNLMLEVGQDGRAVVLIEQADRAFDFAHAQQTNPTLFVHSANQNTTQWISVTHNGTNGIIDVGTGGINFSDGVNFTTGTFIVLPDDARFQLGTNNGQIAPITAQTPNSPMLMTGTLSNSYNMIEVGDVLSDFQNGVCGSAACSDPTLTIHSATANTTDWTSYTHKGQAPAKLTVTVDAATTFAITSGYVVLACTGAETINTITGGVQGMVLYLENSDTECTLADDEDPTAANAIDLTGAANDVGAVSKMLMLIYTGAHWKQLAESDN